MVDSFTNNNLHEMKPRIVVMGVGGAGGNALNNMIAGGLEGVEFIAANTDAQALLTSKSKNIIQIGKQLTEGLGAGSRAEIGAAAAEEAAEEIRAKLDGAHMVFVTAGMGGGTGSGAAPVISRIARELGILTVGVVTKPFQFEGANRMNTAEKAIKRLRENVDTLIVIPNQNLFRVTNEKTTFADAFAMADEVLHSGIACITDLMVKEGLINLDFADVKIVMSNMGQSMMGSGVASGENRGKEAAQIAITNPLLDDVTLDGAKGVLVSIIGGKDLTLFEVEQAAETIRKVVDQDANIIVGATFDASRENDILVSVLATGLGGVTNSAPVMKPALLQRDVLDNPPQKAEMKVSAEKTALPEEEARPEPKLFQPKVSQESVSALSASQNDSFSAPFPEMDEDLSQNDAETEWVSDEGVTIEPIKSKKKDRALFRNVSKKAHKNDDLENVSKRSFTPAPTQKVNVVTKSIPEIEDFSPMAQKVLKASKEDGIGEKSQPMSLFEKLSGLGKKMSKSKDVSASVKGDISQDTERDNRALETGKPIEQEALEPEMPVYGALEITEEEENQIPSFFKRKA